MLHVEVTSEKLLTWLILDLYALRSFKIAQVIWAIFTCAPTRSWLGTILYSRYRLQASYLWVFYRVTRWVKIPIFSASSFVWINPKSWMQSNFCRAVTRSKPRWLTTALLRSVCRSHVPNSANNFTICFNKTRNLFYENNYMRCVYIWINLWIMPESP